MPAARRRRGKSEYGVQLAEKQKVRDSYLLRERQFKNYFARARSPEDIYTLLELRLDSIVFRLGFAKTRGLARQLVSHGHVIVNGRKVTIASYQTRNGDLITIRPQSMGKGVFSDLDEYLKKYEVPSWLKLDKDKKEGTVVSVPSLEEAGMELNLQSVLEFYSR